MLTVRFIVRITWGWRLLALGKLLRDLLLHINPEPSHDAIQKVPKVDEDDEETWQEGVAPRENQNSRDNKNGPSIGDPVCSEPIGDLGAVVVQNFSQCLVEARVKLLMECQKRLDDSFEIQLHNGIDKRE